MSPEEYIQVLLLKNNELVVMHHRMAAALVPFARYAGHLNDGEHPDVGTVNSDPGAPTFGDCRTAVAVMAEVDPGNVQGWKL